MSTPGSVYAPAVSAAVRRFVSPASSDPAKLPGQRRDTLAVTVRQSINAAPAVYNVVANAPADRRLLASCAGHSYPMGME